MERANCFIALGGDKENTVPRIVTPPEVEILRRIHSDDAVHDIEVIGDDPGISKQAELARLAYDYNAARDEDGKRFHQLLYPAHTLLPSTFAELGLPDTFYKATARAVPAPRTQTVQTEQTHAAPGVEPRDMSSHIPAGEFEPIEVPADPDTQPESAGRMVDPRTQHQNDEPPGVAINATDGSADGLRARAEEQGTGPGSVPTQTGARVAEGNEADGGPVGTGSKTREQQHAEVTPKEPSEGNLFA